MLYICNTIIKQNTVMKSLDFFSTSADYFVFSSDGSAALFDDYSSAIEFAYNACDALRIDVSVFSRFTFQTFTYSFDYDTMLPVLNSSL